jgi:hypothetical protein
MDRPLVPAAVEVGRRIPRPAAPRRLRLLAVLPLLLVAGPQLVSRAAAAPAPAPSASAALPALAILPAAEGLSRQALAAALDALACARSRGVAGRDDLLTLIDYSLPSTTPRLWVLDLAHGKVLFHELVAHGAGSGDNYATRFSNTVDSRQTSLGLFLTGETYEGKNGYSLRLRGLDPGTNDRAEERSIVMHGAWYVSSDQIQRYGRLGRSWGCPALPAAVAQPVIDTIKSGTFVFAYTSGPAWRRASSTASCAPGTGTGTVAVAAR